jgi:hypothetical protein
MCPASVTSVAMIVASGASTGGLSALIARTLVRITSLQKFLKLEAKAAPRIALGQSRKGVCL